MHQRDRPDSDGWPPRDRASSPARRSARRRPCSSGRRAPTGGITRSRSLRTTFSHASAAASACPGSSVSSARPPVRSALVVAADAVAIDDLARRRAAAGRRPPSAGRQPAAQPPGERRARPGRPSRTVIATRSRCFIVTITSPPRRTRRDESCFLMIEPPCPLCPPWWRVSVVYADQGLRNRTVR